jgi:hypothetical protein
VGQNGRKNVYFVVKYVRFTFIGSAGEMRSETWRRLGRRRVRLYVIWDEEE